MLVEVADPKRDPEVDKAIKRTVVLYRKHCEAWAYSGPSEAIPSVVRWHDAKDLMSLAIAEYRAGLDKKAV